MYVSIVNNSLKIDIKRVYIMKWFIYIDIADSFQQCQGLVILKGRKKYFLMKILISYNTKDYSKYYSCIKELIFDYKLDIITWSMAFYLSWLYLQLLTLRCLSLWETWVIMFKNQIKAIPAVNQNYCRIF